MPKKSTRKSTGKRLRFEIFKRDHFTCQYCGAQPPSVVLVADHITPVADGGSTTPENLITACETCNQGKADRPLAEYAIRPDADLMYLETQQEVAELQRFQKAKAERDAATDAVITQLENTWLGITEFNWVPSRAIFITLLLRHEPETVEDAIVDVACKIAGGYLRSDNGKWVPYLYSVARNMTQEQSA